MCFYVNYLALSKEMSIFALCKTMKRLKKMKKEYLKPNSITIDMTAETLMQVSGALKVNDDVIIIPSGGEAGEDEVGLARQERVWEE